MLNHVGTQQLETDRLILRRHEITDAGDIFRNWVTDPEVSRFWGWEPHKDIEETKSILAQWIDAYADPKTYHWIIVLKSISQAIGYIYLNELDETNNSAAVHFALGRSYWNQGLMSEACKGVLSFAFSVMNVENVCTRHHIDNPASGRVMQKCGMRHITTMYKQIPECEELSGDYCFYGITASDWEHSIT